MYLRRAVPFFCFLLLVCLVVMPSLALALDIKAMRLGEHSDKTRLVLDLDQSVSHTVFTLNNPDRLVVDLPNFSNRASYKNLIGRAHITAIRDAPFNATTRRLVIQFDRPVTKLNDFILPAKDGNNPRLVIDWRADITVGAIPDTPYVQPAINENLLPKPKPAIVKPLVVIDAGHGGADPGAIASTGSYEKHITLAIAKALQDELENTGRYRVSLTRERDVYLKLYQRVARARQKNADMFISIHADTVANSKVRGVSVYTLSNKASDAQSARLAEKENQADLIAGVDLSGEEEDVANILINLAMRETMNQSRFLAGTMVDTLKSRDIRLLQTPHRHAGFAVLKAPDIPSILVETGFLSNRQEAKNLATSAYRKKIAKALADGIDNYFKTLERYRESG